MKLVYRGNQQDGIDIPGARIANWKPGEAREVPDDLAEELLHRSDEFEEAD